MNTTAQGGAISVEDQAIETAWHIFQRERDREPATILRRTFRLLVIEMAADHGIAQFEGMAISPTTEFPPRDGLAQKHPRTHLIHNHDHQSTGKTYGHPAGPYHRQSHAR
ncbi:hypothetical protein [Prosthecobacter sp.]|uniref:hypothetical protein n=1 Tax=Prosthecobacter sp. TaxID=1965333 RepID=UPI0037839403